MDPEACLKRAADALEERDMEECRAALDDLSRWWRDGGGLTRQELDEKQRIEDAWSEVKSYRNKLQEKGGCHYCGMRKDNPLGLCPQCGRFPPTPARLQMDTLDLIRKQYWDDVEREEQEF